MNTSLIWISAKLLKQNKSRWLAVTGWVSLLGLSLGVACLVVSMAVMSGFEDTLKRSVADVTGHVHLIRWSNVQIDKEKTLQEIKSIEPSFKAATAFAFIEGVVAHQGKLVGAYMQGVDETNFQDVLVVKKRLVQGAPEITSEKPGKVLIGIGLAKNLNLKVGDDFKMVIPIFSELDPHQFRRRIETFKVGGIVDLGKNDYNERMILGSLKSVQSFAEIGDQFTGFLLRFADIDKAPAIAAQLSRKMGGDFRVRDWHEINENLFEAVKIERVVIFFVIMVIVLAAAFNVASSLYINIVQKYQDLAILKATGLTPKQIIIVFSWQGLFLGFFGTLFGILLGLLLCVGFVWLEKNFGILPGSVYKIDHIDLNIRAQDLFAIVCATLLLSWLATLAPARKGAKMTPVEGLRHD